MMQTDKEYAAALFELASEDQRLTECLSDLVAVRELVRENPEFPLLLSSPAIPLSERLSLIEEAFAGRVQDTVVNFMLFLCEKGRFSLICDIIEEFEALCREASRTCEARIVCAAELDDERKATLVAKLEKMLGKKIEPVYSIDPSLIGGVLVQVDGKVFDGTLKSRLRDVKDVMLNE